jgi:hypothetical protein
MAPLLEVPERIDGYRVEATLGRGGDGVVLRVHDEALDRPAALKLLTNGGDAEARARFFVEARAAGRIVHPNVVQVYTVGVFEGRPYLVEELVEGCALSELLELRGRLRPAAVVEIASQAAQALGRAAEAGVLHRDVKPQNLLLAEDGQIKLTDFGLAKLLRASAALTDPGTTLGTPHYMSPEQGRGETLDARSDQYALGATLYHLLTGVTPFDADEPLAVLFQHSQLALTPLAERVPDCPPGLAAIVERMLAKRPEERFPDFEALLDALDALELEEPRALPAPLELEPAEPEPSAGTEPASIPPAPAARAEPGRGGLEGLGPWAALAAGLAIFLAIGATPPRLSVEPRAAWAGRDPAPQARSEGAPTRRAPSDAPRREAAPATPTARDTAGWVERLTPPDPQEAVRAARELGRRRDVDAIEPLRAAARDARRPQVRRAAQAALDRLFRIEPEVETP